MKLAYSTLGCPGWTWPEIFGIASDLKMDGIEIRGIGNEMYAPKTHAFSPENIDKTIKQINSSTLTIPIFSSGAAFIGGDKSVTEAKEYIDLAKKVGTPYVRVLCEPLSRPTEKMNLKKAVSLYQEMLDYGGENGVMPLIETSGALSDSRKMADFLELTDRSNAFVLWDIHHPYRYFNETPAETIKNLSKKVKYVHVKDSISQNGQTVYRMMGYGDVPVLDAMQTLKDDGYDGFVSFEWLKRWAPDLEEPGIVFSHFSNYMRLLFDQLK